MGKTGDRLPSGTPQLVVLPLAVQLLVQQLVVPLPVVLHTLPPVEPPPVALHMLPLAEPPPVELLLVALLPVALRLDMGPLWGAKGT